LRLTNWLNYLESIKISQQISRIDRKKSNICEKVDKKVEKRRKLIKGEKVKNKIHFKIPQSSSKLRFTWKTIDFFYQPYFLFLQKENYTKIDVQNSFFKILCWKIIFYIKYEKRLVDLKIFWSYIPFKAFKKQRFPTKYMIQILKITYFPDYFFSKITNVLMIFGVLRATFSEIFCYKRLFCFFVTTLF